MSKRFRDREAREPVGLPPGLPVTPPPPLEAARLRMRCLEAAVECRSSGTTAADIVSKARDFETYVKGEAAAD